MKAIITLVFIIIISFAILMRIYDGRVVNCGVVYNPGQKCIYEKLNLIEFIKYKTDENN